MVFLQKKSSPFRRHSSRYCALLILLGINSFNFIHAQNIRRSLSNVNSNFDCGMVKMASTYNQLYVFGYGGSNLEFVYNQITPTRGSHQLFVAKYNDTGLFIKAKTLGGTGANMNGMATHFGTNLSSYCGIYSGNYYENNTRFSAAGNKGMFVVTLDSALNTAWRTFIYANEKFHCNLLCPDGKGNLLAAGFFSDSLRAGSFNFTSTRQFAGIKNKDIFLLKINSIGNIIGAQTFGGFGNDYPTALTADINGTAILGAIISDTVQLGDYTYNQQSHSKCIVFKTNLQGHTSWVTSFSGMTASVPEIKYSSKNTLYCALNFKSVMYVKSGFVVTKLNTGGEYNQFGILEIDTFGKLKNYVCEGSDNPCSITGLQLDNADNPYICGEFECTFTGFNKLNKSWSFKNTGFGDVFTAAYKADLSRVYQRQQGGVNYDCASHLILWNAKPTICGYYKFNYHLNADSNVKITYNGEGYAQQFDYYMGYSPGPNQKLAGLYTNWINTTCGFFTDIVDNKSRIKNNYLNTYIKTKPAAEKLIWDHELYGRSSTGCGSSYLRFHWFAQQSNSYPFGMNLQYKLNGTSYDYYGIQNYRYTTTTFHTLIVNSEDRCYIDTINYNHIIMAQDYVRINYDKTKYPNYIVLCKNDSVCLTASNTKGLKYLWQVNEMGYRLDTGNMYNPEKKWVYAVTRTDTFYSSTICIKKKSVVNLLVEPNSICLDAASVYIDKDGLGADDSLLYFFNDTNSYFCKGQNTPRAEFKIRVLDKKTGYYRYPNIYTNVKINGKNYAPNYQTDFNVPIPDTGQISVAGTAQLGCEVYNFSVSRRIHLRKPKISVNGNLSNCHTGDQIFTADSGFLKYNWYAFGLPDTPTITYLKPWKIRVVGSMQNINVFAYADTTDNQTCYVSAYKNVSITPTLGITSSLVPAQLCPSTQITLTAGKAKNYEWFPGGETTQSIQTNEPGIYYCKIKDTSDCEFVSNKINVSGFSEPDLLVSPDDGVCPGKEAEIFVVAPLYASVQWTNPSSWGNKLQVKTSQTGTYTCEVKICKTTYPLNVKIYPKITNTQTQTFNLGICTGQTLKLSCHDSESYSYKWIPTDLNNRHLYIKIAGIFKVQARDVCDNLYDADIFNITQTTGNGQNKTIDTLVCGWKSSQFNLRKINNINDTGYTCRWLDNNDTAFQRLIKPGSAKYTALIKNQFCTVPDTFRLSIVNHKIPQIKITPVSDVCTGSMILLEANVSDSNAQKSKIVWNQNLGFGEKKQTQVWLPTWYKALYKDTCATVTDSILVSPNQLQATFDMNYNANTDSIAMQAFSIRGVIKNYRWYLNGKWVGNAPNLTLPASEKPDEELCLIAENAQGCVDTICRKIPVYNDGTVYIPNVFYPGSSINNNKHFEPITKKSATYTMLIYNRWGQKICEGNNQTQGWDGWYMGAPCMSGMYVYIIYIKYVNPNGDPRMDSYKGTVMLLE